MKKEQALQVIEQNKGNLTYVSPGEIQQVTPEYEAVLETFNFTKDNFVNVGGGTYYPTKDTQNKISRACGISYTENCGTRKLGSLDNLKVIEEEGVFMVRGEFSVIGWAQGTRIKADGELITSSVQEYEFDVVARANEDIINSLTKEEKWKRIDTKIKALVKMRAVGKFPLRRASVGAQLAVVRELAAIPTGWKEKEVTTPMTFHQICKNPDYKRAILSNISKQPGGMQAITDSFLGNKHKAFGPGDELPKQVNDQPEVEPETEEQPKQETPPPIDQGSTDEDLDKDAADRENLKDILRKYIEIMSSDDQNKATCQALVDNPASSLDKLIKAVEHCRKYYKGAE